MISSNAGKSIGKLYRLVSIIFLVILVTFFTLIFVHTGALSLFTKIYVAVFSLICLFYTKIDFHKWKEKH